MHQRDDDIAPEPGHARRCDAVILDLDGVVTRTAALHRIAWKQTFDQLLRRECPEQPPFDENRDYARYVDGMPRLDGVRRFLASRAIELPEGDEDDTLDDATVHGIGNTKNQRFHGLLEERGAEVFDDAVESIRRWKRDGKPVAIVSSSRNCRAILQSVGLIELFDARVDAQSLDELGLEGKPAPDMYLEAARRLNVAPSSAGVIEDALAGVEAGRRGGFALVVGVDRTGDRADELREHGADLVVRSLDEIDLSPDPDPPPPPPPALLLKELDQFEKMLGGRAPALFLDYDGTLTPIVERPEMATIGEDTRDLLRQVAARHTVAVVSGRDRPDVQRLVGLGAIVYAGSHGFDIRGPEGLAIQHAVGDEAVPALDAAQRELERDLADIRGAQIERKKFSIAIHDRNVSDEQVPLVERAVDAAVGAHEGLRKSRGKRVFEIQPDIDWHKGRAVLWLLDALDLDPGRSTPVYIGDDTTDEDAFEVLRNRGIGVLVADEARPTAARYRLRDVREVRRFLRWLADRPDRGPKQETA